MTRSDKIAIVVARLARLAARDRSIMPRYLAWRGAAIRAEFVESIRVCVALYRERAWSNASGVAGCVDAPDAAQEGGAS